MARSWDLDATRERYRASIDELAPFLRPGGRRGMDDQETFLLRTRMVHVVRGFPALPDDLMSAPRQRARAVAMADRLYEVFAPATQRHFDEVTAAP